MDAVSVTAAAGFSANGMHCGIKADGVPDLSTVFADTSVPTAAVFTTSLTAAPPVQLSRRHAGSGSSRGVIINSGSANAGTGASGYRDAEEMTTALAGALGCMSQEILVCSTGPIGGRLPINDIANAVPGLVAGAGSTAEHGTNAALGILTTDSVPKEAVARHRGVTVGGMAKGAGMVRPDMATMLAFITTDALVPTAGAHHTGPFGNMLARATASTFNALNIDGWGWHFFAADRTGGMAAIEFLDGKVKALTDEEKLGLDTFIKVGCTECHTTRLLGGDSFQVLGKARTDRSAVGLC